MRTWWRERVLWWRCFLPVVFAHKPLCESFHGHHLKIGGLHVCRSCLILYSGAAVTLAVLAVSPGVSAFLGLPLIGLTATTLLLSYPPLYRRYPRALRDVLRFSLGMCGAAAAGMIVLGAWQSGLIAGALLGAAKLIYSALRSRNRDHICRQCPEFSRRGICSGFRYKSRRMRLYERGLVRYVLGASRRMSG